MPGTGKHYDEVAPFGIHVVHFKGATDPSLDAANFVASGKLWWDTANGLMKCRDDADTGWDMLYEIGASASAVGAAGGDLTGTYPNPTIKSDVSMPGSPTTTTQTPGDNSTKVATTAYADAAAAAAAAAVVNSAPGVLDTLDELAAALGDDANFATTTATALAGKIPKSLIDAKGDLIAGTADDTPARLAVGSNGQVLTADSGEAAGVKWATPSSAGANSGAISTKSADYTATASDYTLLVDASGAVRTITLPAAASSSGLILVIKKIDSSGNAVTIDGNASETIDGATTQSITTQYQSYTIQCNGSAWYIL